MEIENGPWMFLGKIYDRFTNQGRIQDLKLVGAIFIVYIYIYIKYDIIQIRFYYNIVYLKAAYTVL